MTPEITIRKAAPRDIERIIDLLHQVNDLHADGRPDLFRHGSTKYTPAELTEIINNPSTPVFVAVAAPTVREAVPAIGSADITDTVAAPTVREAVPALGSADIPAPLLGYCFCIVQDHSASNNLQPVKTLYIDDLCVDSHSRGRHIGRQLYEYVKARAKAEGFHNITLNVWTCNPSALRFYESLGMTPQKIGMEQIL